MLHFFIRHPMRPGNRRNSDRDYPELTLADGRRIISLGDRIILDLQGLETLTCDSTMVSNKQPPGRGIRGRNRATIRISGEQGRPAVSSCFLTGITARGLFRMENQR